MKFQHTLVFSAIAFAFGAQAQEVAYPVEQTSQPYTLEESRPSASELSRMDASAKAVETSDDLGLRASVSAGLTNSSQLSSEIYGLEAVMHETDIAFGDLLPTLDLRGAAGRERSKVEQQDAQTYNHDSYGIEARQNLFNGFATQARYLGSYANAMAVYYQALDTANSIALESSIAHTNVARFMALTKLAEDNLGYHRDLVSRIAEKVERGVSRPADLEQAKSRLNLAMSNLASEKSGTFAAMADYQKITDKVWPSDYRGDYVVETNFEIADPRRLTFALNNHQSLRAANAQIYSAEHSVTAAKEGFFPRIDLRAKSDVYSNYLSSFEGRTISSIDLLASMNLYRGGADNAAREAAIRRKYQASDRKLEVCKTIRRNTQVALYEVMNLEKRVGYFRDQSIAIENARAAYDQQFRIGRRELLDLLNAENEYYRSQRNLINVEADLSVAKLKLLSASGQLIELFGVEGNISIEEPVRKNVWLYDDVYKLEQTENNCPTSLINLDEFQLPAIGFEPAFQSVSNTDPLLVNTSLDLAQLGKPVISPQQFEEQGENPADVSRKLTELTQSWADAWQNRDINNYINFYAPTFIPEKGSYESWQHQRRTRIARARSINIQISDLQVIPDFEDPNVYETVFTQAYSASHYRETSKKVLTWQKVDGDEWRIIREQNLPENTVYKNEVNLLATIQN